eukprot:TRINITY_DN4094_c0_g3_i1.p2 TRINITY_DN4094_c0_g3~~TRINITY_DN4094_c0_g3_i1.p2  ORF type:complete len:174 (-),score=44.58 TRINITY_DN4094_c0_g3_i1:51-572(-)
MWRRRQMMRRAQREYLTELWNMTLESMKERYQKMGKKHKLVALRLSQLPNKVRDKALSQYFAQRKQVFAATFHKWFQFLKRTESRTAMPSTPAKADSRPRSFSILDGPVNEQQVNANKEMRSFKVARKRYSIAAFPVLGLSQVVRSSVKPWFEYKPDNGKMTNMILEAINESK